MLRGAKNDSKIATVTAEQRKIAQLSETAVRFPMTGILPHFPQKTSVRKHPSPAVSTLISAPAQEINKRFTAGRDTFDGKKAT